MSANNDLPPFVKVVGFQFVTNRYCRRGEGSNRIILACGHEHYQKASVPVPRRKRCRDCKHQTDGTVS